MHLFMYFALNSNGRPVFVFATSTVLLWKKTQIFIDTFLTDLKRTICLKSTLSEI